MKNFKNALKVAFLLCSFTLLPKAAISQVSQTFLASGVQYGVPAKSFDNILSAYFFEVDNYWEDLYGAKIGANFLLTSDDNLQGQIYLGGLVKTDTYESAFPFFSYGVGATISTEKRSFMTYGELGYSFFGANISVSLMVFEKELYQTIKFAYSYSLDNLFY